MNFSNNPSRIPEPTNEPIADAKVPAAVAQSGFKVDNILKNPAAFVAKLDRLDPIAGKPEVAPVANPPTREPAASPTLNRTVLR